MDSKSPIDLNGCKVEYQSFFSCLQTEKQRLLQKERELREVVLGLKSEKPLEEVVTIRPSEMKMQEGIFN